MSESDPSDVVEAFTEYRNQEVISYSEAKGKLTAPSELPGQAQRLGVAADLGSPPLRSNLMATGLEPSGRLLLVPCGHDMMLVKLRKSVRDHAKPDPLSVHSLENAAKDGGQRVSRRIAERNSRSHRLFVQINQSYDLESLICYIDHHLIISISPGASFRQFQSLPTVPTCRSAVPAPACWYYWHPSPLAYVPSIRRRFTPAADSRDLNDAGVQLLGRYQRTLCNMATDALHGTLEMTISLSAAWRGSFGTLMAG
nr:hypothetical protein CFP56_37048 [Quercus suber]